MGITSERHKVTVTLPRPAGDDALVPPGAQVIAELAAAAGSGEGLMTAWTSSWAVLSMLVEVPRQADAPSAGWAVARVAAAVSCVENTIDMAGRLCVADLSGDSGLLLAFTGVVRRVVPRPPAPLGRAVHDGVPGAWLLADTEAPAPANDH